MAPAPAQPTLGLQEPAASFWPLVKVEAAEALLLALVQGLALALPAWLLGVPPARLLLGAWPLVIPYLLATSWVFFMVPLVLAGKSPMMGFFGVTLPENTAERRMAFSLVHLLSVVCFPLSFLSMILSPRHQTLAELLSGQELLSRPTARMR
jgi:fatty acid desaturase